MSPRAIPFVALGCLLSACAGRPAVVDTTAPMTRPMPVSVPRSPPPPDEPSTHSLTEDAGLPDAARDVPVVATESESDAVDPATPDHATVTVSGVRFTVRATARRGRAGYGLTVSVDAASGDGREHQVSLEPLSVSGSVAEPDGAGAAFGMSVSDVAVLTLRPGESAHGSAHYPVERGDEGIHPGQTLDLSVGLFNLDGIADPPHREIARVVMVVPHIGSPRAHVLVHALTHDQAPAH